MPSWDTGALDTGSDFVSAPIESLADSGPEVWYGPRARFAAPDERIGRDERDDGAGRSRDSGRRVADGGRGGLREGPRGLVVRGDVQHAPPAVRRAGRRGDAAGRRDL